MKKMHNPPTGKIKNTYFIFNTTQPHEILEKFEPILTTILHEHNNILNYQMAILLTKKTSLFLVSTSLFSRSKIVSFSTCSM